MSNFNLTEDDLELARAAIEVCLPFGTGPLSFAQIERLVANVIRLLMEECAFDHLKAHRAFQKAWKNRRNSPTLSGGAQ